MDRSLLRDEGEERGSGGLNAIRKSKNERKKEEDGYLEKQKGLIGEDDEESGSLQR